jgi:hypothetical protein
MKGKCFTYRKYNQRWKLFCTRKYMQINRGIITLISMETYWFYLWFWSLSFPRYLNSKIPIRYFAPSAFMLPCIEFKMFLLDEIKWQPNHVSWLKGPSNIWLGNLRAFFIQELTSVFEETTRVVQASVHFSHNWSQLLPYIDMRKT